MRFLSDLLRNKYGNGWKQLGGTEEIEALARPLEEALAPHLAAGPGRLPALALRAEELVVAWLTARRMEDVLRNEGVCRMQQENAKLFKEVHPVVEKAMKARERVRKALQELEDACKTTAAAGGSGALSEEAEPLLRLGDGVLEDAVDFEKRKQKRAGRTAQTKDAAEKRAPRKRA